jgi:MFS family permease
MDTRSRLPLVLYLASLASSVLGNSVAAIALPLLLLSTTGNVLGAGVLAVATTVPSVLAGVFGGWIVDRFDRRRVSMLSDVVSAASVAALPVVDAVLGLDLGWFVLLGVLGAVGDVPGMTARDALVPAVARVSGTTTQRLVALRETVSSLGLLVGPAIAGVLVATLDGSSVFWVTAATSALAVVLTALLPRSVGQVVGGRESGGWRGTTQGLRRLVGDARLRAVTALSMASAVVLVAFQGLLLPVHFTAIGRPDQLGFVLSSVAAGMLVGGALFVALSGRASRRTWVLIGVLGSLPGAVLLALLPGTGWLLAGAALFGLTSAPVGAVLGAAVLELTPDRFRGRVNGAQTSVLMLASPLGVAGAAALVEGFDLRTAALTVLAVWVVAVFAATVSPALRRLVPDGSQDVPSREEARSVPQR